MVEHLFEICTFHSSFKYPVRYDLSSGIRKQIRNLDKVLKMYVC